MVDTQIVLVGSNRSGAVIPEIRRGLHVGTSEIRQRIELQNLFGDRVDLRRRYHLSRIWLAGERVFYRAWLAAEIAFPHGLRRDRAPDRGTAPELHIFKCAEEECPIAEDVSPQTAAERIGGLLGLGNRSE